MSGPLPMPLSSAVANPARPPRRAIRLGEFSWIWIALAVLVAASAVLAPGTLRPGSIAAMLPFAAALSIVAVGQTLVIQQRGLDMAAAGIISVAGILAAKLGGMSGSPALGVVATVLACAAIGFVSGFLVARVNISPIVATLATGALVSGIARLQAKGSALPIAPQLQDLAHATVLGLPLSIACAYAMIAVVAVMMARTIVGRRFVAVGVNPETALCSGVVVLRYRIGTYVIAAVLYALAGIFLAAFIGYASPTAGDDYLLPGIAAVVVGGTPFTGGRGSVVASGAAALFMAQLGQMVLALGAGPAQQLLVQAAAIVIATSIRRVPVAAAQKLLSTIGSKRGTIRA